MNRSILETAVSNRALHLELAYRPTSTLREGGTIFDEPGDIALALPGFESTLPDEFACLLQMM